MMVRGLILVLCFCGVAVASRSANQYIENVLQSRLPNEVRAMGLEVAPLQNFNVVFQGTQANASFTNGYITGFSQVRRASECSGPKLFRNELTINCTLNLNSLTTDYQVVARNRSSVNYATVSGRVSDALVYVIVSGQSPNYVGSVKSFQVTRLNLANPTFSGLPYAFQKQVSVLQNVYRSNVHSYVLNVMQQRFVYALGRAVAYLPMPRQ